MRRYDELGVVDDELARVGRADVQERERGERRACGIPAGEERAVDDDAAQTRMGGEKVAWEVHHGVIPGGAGVVRVHAEPEDLKERRGGLEEADPGQDAARACGEVEVLYMEEVLREHVDGVKLRAATTRRRRRHRRHRRRRRERPRVQRHARLAWIWVGQ